MKRLEDLPEVAARQLGGLSASAQLRGRIQIAAAAEAEAKAPRRKMRWQPVIASVAAAALCLTVGLWSLPKTADEPSEPVPSAAVLDSRSAGDTVQHHGRAVRALLDVPTGSISVSGSSSNANGGLFAPETNGNFPLLIVNGAAYRLLESPASLDAGLLGESLGEVTEYTLEPALSTGEGIVSNTASAGENVYAVSGMNGAMAAASVGGVTRVFQRVSFAGTAVVGSETLADTLTLASHVTAMDWSGVGVIDDASAAQSLMQTLLDNAVYTGASASGSGTLLVYLDNGLTLQLAVGNDAVSACGTWSCPEFFEAYALALN